MPTGQNTTEAEKQQIKMLHMRGWKTGQIARELGMKRQTVTKWVGRLIHGSVQMTKQKPAPISIKSAEADYSRAKFTRSPFNPPQGSRICNGSMTELFDPTKHLTVL